MSSRGAQSTFEEVNRFPEKVADSALIDGDPKDSFLQDESDSILGELEEIALGEGFHGFSASIEDENPAGEMVWAKNAGTKSSSRPFDVESLAREIDSMKINGSRFSSDEDSSKSDFLRVLDDEDRVLIEEVTKKADEIELEMFEPVADLEHQDDRAELIFIADKDYNPVSLWKDDSDYYVTAVEGFPEDTPETLIHNLTERKNLPQNEILEVTDSFAHNETKSSSGNDGVDSGDSEIVHQEDELLRALDDASFEVTDDDLHDATILEDLIFSDDKKDDEFTEPFSLDDASEEDNEILSLSPDELWSIEDESAETEEDEAEKDIIIEDDKEETIIPDDFILTPIDLSEAEKIAREDILTLDEDDLIEEGLSIEKRDITPPSTEKETTKIVERTVQYLHPEGSSITRSHRESIEEDITASDSLVIEEDVREIQKRFEENSEPSEDDTLLDITDNVVILEDESDVDRLTMTIPEEKREDVKKLLHYLDGLFEKLPEDVVRSFADSEYFDLYVKIMNDLGDK